MGKMPMVGSKSPRPRRKRPTSRCHQGPTGHRPAGRCKRKMNNEVVDLHEKIQEMTKVHPGAGLWSTLARPCPQKESEQLVGEQRLPPAAGRSSRIGRPLPSNRAIIVVHRRRRCRGTTCLGATGTEEIGGGPTGAAGGARLGTASERPAGPVACWLREAHARVVEPTATVRACHPPGRWPQLGRTQPDEKKPAAESSGGDPPPQPKRPRLLGGADVPSVVFDWNAFVGGMDELCRQRLARSQRSLHAMAAAADDAGPQPQWW